MYKISIIASLWPITVQNSSQEANFCISSPKFQLGGLTSRLGGKTLSNKLKVLNLYTRNSFYYMLGHNNSPKAPQFSVLWHYICSGLLLVILCSASVNSHSFQGLIYGKVTLTDGSVKNGIIQGKNRQLFWEDILMTLRKDNPPLKFLKSSEIKNLSDQEKKEKIEWGFMQIWKNNYPSRTNRLSCRFGDIASITSKGDREALLTLKNGSTIHVEGSDKYQDIGRYIHLSNTSGKWQRIDWKKIDKIEFEATPSKALVTTVKPLYGTVKTRYGNLTGYVKWDQDEGMTSSILDGKEDGVLKKIRFWKISSIARITDNSSLVMLSDGTEMTLTDTDDVGTSNHGLIIFVRNVGAVTVKWKDFIDVNFDKAQDGSKLLAYDSFKPTEALSGWIKTNGGEKITGRIVYDLDEQWGSDMLEGYKEGLNYRIPFGSIRSIVRKNEQESLIVLHSGTKIVLGGQADVNDKNWGFLMWTNPEKPQYIPWNQVQIVYFK